MTKVAFDAKITMFDSDFTPNQTKEMNIHLSVAGNTSSEKLPEIYRLFIEHDIVRVRMFDKESNYDFTERKVERRREFCVRLMGSKFFCFVSVNYYINGEWHHNRIKRYENISLRSVQGLYDSQKVHYSADMHLGFRLHSTIERVDFIPITRINEKELRRAIIRLKQHIEASPKCFSSRVEKDAYDKRTDRFYNDILKVAGITMEDE